MCSTTMESTVGSASRATTTTTTSPTVKITTTQRLDTAKNASDPQCQQQQQQLLLQEEKPTYNHVPDGVDRFEDQVDDIAYKELVPLHIKLALEDKVFGWSNLFSAILGHVGITLAAYQFTYVALGYIIILTIPWVQTYDNYSWTTSILKSLLSLWAAVSAYRMVRRRQHVWFRSAYGSKEYMEDYQRRRTEVAEIDSTTLLGRIRTRRNVYLRGRLQRTLTQAETRFDSWTRKKARRRRPSFQTFPTNQTKSIENDQVLFPCGPIKNMPYSHGCFFGAAPFLLANPDWISILRHLMPDVYIELSRRVHHNAPAPKLIHWAENNPVVAAFGTANELANRGKVVNLEWDVFLEPRLVRRVELVLNQRNEFLATVRATCKNSCNSGSDDDGEDDDDVTRPLLWTAEQRNILEYLDQELERRSSQLVERMLIAHGKLTQLLMEQTGRAKDYNYSRVARTRRTLGGGMYARQWMAVYAEALRLGMQMAENFLLEETTTTSATTATTTTTMREEEEEEEVASSDDGLEKIDGDWNPRMVRTESCPLLFHEDAAGVGKKANRTSLPKLLPHSGSSIEGGRGASCLSSLASSNCPNSSIAESVALLRLVTKKVHPIGLVLDMKSRHVPKRVWAIVVDYLNAAGARVEAIASFTIDEIRDVSHLCRSPMVEIIFCHSAGEMQRACHEGILRYGDTVFVNGGSLLWEAPTLTTGYLMTLFCGEFDPATAMSQYNLLPFTSTKPGLDNTLKAYKERLNLKIGLYVQEFGIDEVALDVLVRYVNSNPTLLEHGLSWGGINGVAVRGIRPSRWNPTDGFSTQRYVSIPWDMSKSANDVPSLEGAKHDCGIPKSGDSNLVL
ncbi:hypothetical protein MHU86_2229 [Fragilaria crotonensis]|nr:hypothetical protein MHU86_2229 [Fragilaria crotonensis]